ncbi:unnamed protein product [Brassica oleracea]
MKRGDMLKEDKTLRLSLGEHATGHLIFVFSTWADCIRWPDLILMMNNLEK